MASVYCFQSCSLLGSTPISAIGEPLQRSEHRIEPGPAVGIEHLQQVKPHRLGDQRERDEVEGELKPAGSLHGCSLEFFRPNHGHEQIDEQQQGNDADNDGFHRVLLQLLAEADVKSAHDKKQNDDASENEVVHRFPFGCSQKRE